MRSLQYRPSSFKQLLFSCGGAQTLARIHALIVISGALAGPHSPGRLIAAYARLGDVAAARAVFRTSSNPTISTWNALIVANSRLGSPADVLRLYRLLAARPGPACPDSSTFTLALRACAHLLDLEAGEEIKNRAADLGYRYDVFVCSSLLNLYAKCGKMDDAVKVFDEMPKRDVVSWTTMITGFAIGMYKRMRLEGMEGDGIAMVGLVQASAALGDVRMGRSVHGYMVRREINLDVLVETSLVDMYAKNGFLDTALFIFNRMPYKNVVSWSTLISGYAQNGLAGDALSMLIKMQDCGLEPDLVALVSFVEEGRYWFDRMVREYRIKPGEKHYACIVDLLARAGHVDKAHELIKSMVIEPGIALHAFLMEDKSHPHYEKIAEMLQKLGFEMRKMSYVPKTEFVFHDLEEDVM
ncbi:putative pentatricopeptide repeat-containing protein, mitochondrial [Ananas comosus]|uniref:Putative pentatricopeptide repeat-containing protein, mitochondrial n=1 Tax=Ananas comosus TaxID=4615 RepID=A0A199VWW0_ANACO|nr:putative pentatricopeptide repeat-containing protein, mitochondrial [Ananas comosus]